MGEDTLFYAVMFAAALTPLLWILIFFLLRERKKGKTIFWIALGIYLAGAIVFYAVICNSKGWDRLAYLLIGCFAIAAYTIMVLILVLILRIWLVHKNQD